MKSNKIFFPIKHLWRQRTLLPPLLKWVINLWNQFCRISFTFIPSELLASDAVKAALPAKTLHIQTWRWRTEEGWISLNDSWLRRWQAPADSIHRPTYISGWFLSCLPLGTFQSRRWQAAPSAAGSREMLSYSRVMHMQQNTLCCESKINGSENKSKWNLEQL